MKKHTWMVRVKYGDFQEVIEVDYWHMKKRVSFLLALAYAIIYLDSWMAYKVLRAGILNTLDHSSWAKPRGPALFDVVSS